MNHVSADQANTERTEVVIVGAGPIGIELAVALKRKSVRTIVLEAGTIGNTMSWWAPQTRWFSSNERISIAGVPLMTPDQSKATREQYLMYLRSIVSQFLIDVRTRHRVTAVSRSADALTVTTAAAGREIGRESSIECRAVVLAIGGTDVPRSLTAGGVAIEGVTIEGVAIEGAGLPHVDGYLREPHRYFGRNVLIIGGRNSAIEAALRLHHVGANVSLSYRRHALPEASIKYWLRPEILGLIDSGRIQAHFNTVPTKITSDHVVLAPFDPSGVTTDIVVPADDVLSLIGYEQDKSLFQAVGVELLDSVQRPQHDPASMQTNVAGVYVAGTAVAGTQTSKYKTFLENCHEHVDKIVASLTGKPTSSPSAVYDSQMTSSPES